MDSIETKNEKGRTEIMETNNTIPTPLLVHRGLLSPEGEINSAMVNAASGALTAPLVDAIWDAHKDAVLLNSIAECLWELYDKADFCRIIHSEAAMFLAYGLPVPETVEAVLASANDDLIETFAYEFLMDFDDARFDYSKDEEDDEI